MPMRSGQRLRGGGLQRSRAVSGEKELTLLAGGQWRYSHERVKARGGPSNAGKGPDRVGCGVDPRSACRNRQESCLPRLVPRRAEIRILEHDQSGSWCKRPIPVVAALLFMSASENCIILRAASVVLRTRASKSAVYQRASTR